MTRSFFTILSCILLTAFIVSCKKSSGNGGNQNNFSGCELTKILDSSDALSIKAHTDVTYDISGAMTNVSTTGTTQSSHSLENSNGQLVVLISASVSETDTVTMSSGHVALIVAHYYSNPESRKVSTFNYDASGVLVSRVDNYTTSGTTETFNYTWQNGDIVSEVSATNSNIYTYDTSLAVQDGDWLKTQQAINMGLGTTYFRNKHCVASYQHNMNAPTYFFYLKDGNNRIVTCNAYTGSSLEVYTYSYYCTP